MEKDLINKRCSYCRKIKNINQYWQNKVKRDGRQTICKECHSYIRDKHYKNNKKSHRRAVKELKQQKVKFLKLALKDYLSRHYCVDCRERDPNVLEFDHINKQKKSQSISNMVGCAYSWEKILKEIEKCVVRCANCHRRRTLKQFGWKRV